MRRNVEETETISMSRSSNNLGVKAVSFIHGSSQRCRSRSCYTYVQHYMHFFRDLDMVNVATYPQGKPHVPSSKSARNATMRAKFQVGMVGFPLQERVPVPR